MNWMYKAIKMCIYENSVRFVFCLTAGMLANNLGQSGHISLTYLLGADTAAQGYYHHVYYIYKKSFSFIQICSLKYSFTFTLLANNRPWKVSKYKSCIESFNYSWTCFNDFQCPKRLTDWLEVCSWVALYN